MTTFSFILLSHLLSDSLLNFLAGFAVLSVGILHGANDLEILSKKFKGSLNHLYFRFLILYLMVVLLGAAFFFIIPSFALILFVIFSSYHFGEQHWGERLSMNYPNLIFYTLYGALVFFMIFTLQYDDVIFIINKISGYTLNYKFFLYTSIGLGITFMVFALFIEQLRIHFIKECIILLLLGFIFYDNSLLFAFAFYFVVWHSLPSLKEQLIYLYGNFNLNSFLKYLKSSIIYWIASLISLLLVYGYIDFEADYFMPLFFSFLAAITFPHTLVIGIMKYKNA
jgi:Brp/Blh family beta-carotene 15,15'-monooxygenase